MNNVNLRKLQTLSNISQCKHRNSYYYGGTHVYNCVDSCNLIIKIIEEIDNGNPVNENAFVTSSMGVSYKVKLGKAI